MPQVLSVIRIDQSHLLRYFLYFCSIRNFVKRTYLLNRHILLQICPLSEFAFSNPCQWPNNGQRKLAHTDSDRHCRKRTIESKVHECSIQYIVLMMSKCNFCTTQVLRHRKQRFASVPRTQKAWCSFFISVCFKTRFNHMKRHTPCCSLLLQIGCIAFILNIAHTHMHCLK